METITERIAANSIIITASFGLLCACPASRSPNANSTNTTPPGKSSIRYSCDFSYFSPSLSSQKPSGDVYFTWLQTGTTLPEGAQAILVSDSDFATRDSSITFIVDKERHVVDQIRDRNGNPLQFDLGAQYVSRDIAIAQAHMRIGNMVLESAPRAIQSAAETRSAAAYVSFSFDARLFNTLKEETLPPVEGYSPLPRKIVSDNGTVCEFREFVKK